MSRKKEMSGLRFGRLLVISDAGRTPQGWAKWECLCDCGHVKTISGPSLRNGTTVSCGCYGKELLSSAAERGEAEDISQEYLKSILHYDSVTGVFTRIKSVSKSVKVGDLAGTEANGYKAFSVLGKTYRAHRLAWLYHHGVFPLSIIDHINRDKSDNRICNLREATAEENQKNRVKNINNTSGFKGVHFRKDRGTFVARAMINGKSRYIGSFRTSKEASDAYHVFAQKQHGEFYKGVSE